MTRAGISQSLKANPKISGFGLNKAAAEKTEKPTASKGAATLDEDEQSERKLGKLPNLPSLADEPGDTAPANDVDDQDDVGDEIRSDEEEAEAAREAAQKRAQEAQAQAQQQDVVMTQGEEAKAEPDPDVKMGEEEEIDPLDAFMNELAVPQDPTPTLPPSRTKKNDVQVFNNDDDDDLTAVGDNTDDILALAAKRKKKDIPTVNHEKVEYEPFRKSFYSEPVELAEMSKEDLDILRADLDNITVRGKEPPKPILKWSQGGFGAQILDVIRDMGFEKPTPIQSQTLPAIMSGRDTIGIAKTGSGKTVAYLLPMFRHIKDQRPLEKLDGPIGIVLAPTRELATQIHRDCKPYLKAMNLRAVCAYGGAPIKDQIAELKRGAEIVVCTPGRMIDLLAANSGRVTNLKRVTYCVLDEADRMFDMGFEPQITKVMNNIRPDRQTVLFSATFPKSMEALARKALTKPLEIVVGGRSVVAAEITQMIEVRPDEKKFTRLLQLLGDLHEVDEDARTLIFVERQETADGMLKDLNRKGYPTVSIHGGREQVDRDQAINDFKAGVFPVMVATSVAARGLDVKQLKLVVNYDSPNHVEDYVHRAGRTGRAGNTGTAVTFVTPEQDRFASFLIRALKDSNQDIPEDLQKLEEVHQERVKAGDAKKAGSGFGGRGIERLDAARDAERARERKQYKTGEEGEEEEEEGEKKEGKQSEVDKLVAKATGKTTERDNQPAEKPAQESAQPLIPTALSDHLNNAMKVQKAATPPPPSSGPKGNDPLAKVNAAVANINSRLGARGKSHHCTSTTLQAKKLTVPRRRNPTRSTHRQPRARRRRFPRHARNQRLPAEGPLGRHEPYQRGQDPRSDRHIHHEQGHLLRERARARARPAAETVYPCRRRYRGHGGECYEGAHAPTEGRHSCRARVGGESACFREVQRCLKVLLKCIGTLCSHLAAVWKGGVHDDEPGVSCSPFCPLIFTLPGLVSKQLPLISFGQIEGCRAKPAPETQARPNVHLFPGFEGFGSQMKEFRLVTPDAIV